jgi:hypothetical protein
MNPAAGSIIPAVHVAESIVQIKLLECHFGLCHCHFIYVTDSQEQRPTHIHGHQYTFCNKYPKLFLQVILCFSKFFHHLPLIVGGLYEPFTFHYFTELLTI